MKMTTGKWIVVALLSGAIGLGIPAAFSHDRDGGGGREHCMKGERGDHAARFKERQAELHDKLKLSTEQEGAWSTFSGKLTPPSRPDDAQKDEASTTAPARMEAMLARMKTRQEQMASNLAAVKEFYGTLTPEQQKVFDEEFGPRGKRRHHDRH
jgi:hypothetical protein